MAKNSLLLSKVKTEKNGAHNGRQCSPSSPRERGREIEEEGKSEKMLSRKRGSTHSFSERVKSEQLRPPIVIHPQTNKLTHTHTHYTSRPKFFVTTKKKVQTPLLVLLIQCSKNNQKAKEKKGKRCACVYFKVKLNLCILTQLYVLIC